MRPSADHGLLAGMHAETPLPALGDLVAVGEEWAPRGRQMPWHEHAQWEIYLQISGTTVRCTDQRSCAMSPGQLFITPPGLRHRVINRGTTSQHNGYIRCLLRGFQRRHPRLAAVWDFTGCRLVEDADSVQAPFQLLLREVSLEQPYRLAGTRCALDAVLIEVTRLLGRGRPLLVAPVPKAVLTARTCLERALERRWSTSELARQAALSPSHLLALFRRHVGMPPHRYLLEQRVRRARHLLAFTDLPITELARELGFASSQAFAKTFRRHAGSTASAFRSARRARPGP